MSNAQRRREERGARLSHSRKKGTTRWHWWTAGAAFLAVIVIVGVVLSRGISSINSAGGNSARSAPAVGTTAPNASFSTLQGATVSIASLRGQPTLVWFVSTWCSSCEAGTQAMANHISQLRTDGVRVVELEMYNDLGQAGPSMASFAHTYAGQAAANPDWSFGQASEAATLRYDPNGYLDSYYLLNKSGQVVYINSSPAATIGSLLAKAQSL